jgi:endonuclease-3
MSASQSSPDAASTRAADLLRTLATQYGVPQPSSPRVPIDELVSTILSQRTSDTNTDRAITSLRARFPTWDAVTDAPTADVAAAIRSGGLANVKAPRIQEVLRLVRQRTGGFDLGFLASMPLDQAQAWLTDLPGVGAKTAACVLLFALQQPAFPVDSHIHRVALRLGLIPPGTNAVRAQGLLEAQVLPAPVYHAHMLLIRHGRQTCTARHPRCDRCVLKGDCPTAVQAA